MVPTLRDRLKALSRTEFGPPAAELAKRELKPGKHLVNDAGVSDHHALIPTEQHADTSRLKPEEKIIWSLIVKRFLALLMPPAVWEKKTYTLTWGDRDFKGSEKVLLEPGWMGLEGRRPGKQTTERLTPGDEFAGAELKAVKKTTSPPPWLTEAGLLTAMEKPSSLYKGKGREFIGEIKKKTKELVLDVKSNRKTFRPRGEKGKTCPFCGKNMLAFKKRGRVVMVCQSLSCGFEENDSREKQMNQKLIKQYSSDDSEGFSLADMLKAKQKR